MDDTTALHFAAQKGHLEVVRFLLNEGASVNGKTRKGMTPLMFGAQSGSLELVKLLVKRKADASSKNKNGKTAASLARDPAVKEVLSQAVLTASSAPECPGQSDSKGAEPSGHQSAADVPEPNNADASAHTEIGPQERPHTVVHDDSVSGLASDLNKQPMVEVQNKRTRPEHEPHSQTSDSESCRPSKLHKVALSFADDDDDEV
ncbi:hypothetical protein ABBQ38_012652 [Trebouxia sp. C0009 RCD-2024]